jgi:hypothetical protein
MMSEAAIAGIRHNGHKWLFEISLDGLPAKIGEWEEGVTSAEDIEKARAGIITRVREFLQRPTINNDMRHYIENVIVDLEMVDAEIEEVRYCLSDLYDQFDFYRVVVLR